MFLRSSSSLGAAAFVLLVASASAFAKEEPLTSPEPDSMGRVHFGPATGEGLGRVTVKAPASENIKVFLDGRYFGKAPITIHSVPKGDYIVEGHYKDGKQVSRPVSVTENEEAEVNLAAGKIETPGVATSQGTFSGEISPQRLLLTKVLIGATAASLVVGILFGVFEQLAEHDYNGTSDQTKRDDISNAGKRDATLANVGFALTGAFAVATVIAGYPLVVKPNAEKSTTISFAPVVGPQMSGGVAALRF
jgi:hypothetical protein